MERVFDIIGRCLLALIGAFWGLLQPTIPFTILCFVAVVIDCYTAWRLAKRIKHRHPDWPDEKIHDKIESDKLKKIFPTMLIIASLIVLLQGIDMWIFPFVELHLANWIAGAFCGVQVWSILENESSENDNSWAKVLQKIMVNKASRHVDNIQEILDEAKKNTSYGKG